MQKVNAKLFALKYKLLKVLTNSIEKDKNALKEGAEITYKDYCKIKLVECTKTTLDRSKVLEICDKYGVDISTLEKTTKYQRLDIDNIPTEVDDKVEDIFNTLEDSNDRVIAKVASKVAGIK
jgi:hypothetical protein